MQTLHKHKKIAFKIQKSVYQEFVEVAVGAHYFQTFMQRPRTFGEFVFCSDIFVLRRSFVQLEIILQLMGSNSTFYALLHICKYAN